MVISGVISSSHSSLYAQAIGYLVWTSRFCCIDFLEICSHHFHIDHQFPNFMCDIYALLPWYFSILLLIQKHLCFLLVCSSLFVVIHGQTDPPSLFFTLLIEDRQIWYVYVGLLIVYGYVLLCITCE